MNFTFEFTKEHVAKLLPKNPHIDQWHRALYQILPEYDINTPLRVAAFVAQCAHESANFTRLRENFNYRWESLRKVFPKYFTSDEMAKQYAHKQEKIANRVYGGRMGNGPESSGDGWRYCGRGLIQLTGKNNYQAFADSIETPIEEISDYLLTFEGATQGSCWFWETNNLNQWADKRDIVTLTRKINGGTNGLDDRKKHYEHALKVLGA